MCCLDRRSKSLCDDLAVVEHLSNNLHDLLAWLPKLAILEADVREYFG